MFHIILYTTDTNHIQKYKLYHGVRLVVKSKEEFYSDRTHATTTTTTTPVKFKEEFTGLTVIELR